MPPDRIEEHTTIKKEIDQPAGNPVLKPGIKLVLAILILLIIAGVAGYFILRKKSNNTQNQSSNTADQIRQSFNPPTSTSPSFNPPEPGSQFAGGPSSPGPSTPAPRATTQPQTPTRSQPVAPAPAAPIAYQNSNLGFALTVPGNWVIDDKQSPNRVVFFDRNTGRIAGYAEVYQNATSNNLNGLAQILQGSPMVSGIRQVSIASRPAIQYSADDGYSGGIATITNNRIYYFHGGLADPNVLSTLKFI